MASKTVPRWLNPLNVIEIQKAVKEEADTVVLEGKLFDIRYFPEDIRINPREGFLPMGWFTRKEIKDWMKIHGE